MAREIYIYKSYEIMLMLCDSGQWTVSYGAVGVAATAGAGAGAGEQG